MQNQEILSINGENVIDLLLIAYFYEYNIYLIHEVKYKKQITDYKLSLEHMYGSRRLLKHEDVVKRSNYMILLYESEHYTPVTILNEGPLELPLCGKMYISGKFDCETCNKSLKRSKEDRPDEHKKLCTEECEDDIMIIETS